MDLITWPIHVLERKGDLSYGGDLDLLRWPVGLGTGQKPSIHTQPSKSRAKSREITPAEDFTGVEFICISLKGPVREGDFVQEFLKINPFLK